MTQNAKVMIMLSRIEGTVCRREIFFIGIDLSWVNQAGDFRGIARRRIIS